MINAQGDITSTANYNTNVVTDYRYDAYGNKTGGGTPVTPYNYRNQYFDSETGLYYLNARYYDSEAGSFIQADTYWGSIVDPASMNLYAYCQYNPVMSSDPSGHMRMSILDTNGGGSMNDAIKPQVVNRNKRPSWLDSFDQAGRNAVSKREESINNIIKHPVASLVNFVKEKAQYLIPVYGPNKLGKDIVMSQYDTYKSLYSTLLTGDADKIAAWWGNYEVGAAEYALLMGSGSALSKFFKSTKSGALSKGTLNSAKNIDRALTASDLGIDASKITKLEGSFKIVDGKAVASVDMIEGNLGFVNPTKVIDNLVNVAKTQGATSIRIQGTIANERLLDVLSKRYNFVTSGGSGGYTEYLELLIEQ